MKYNGIAANFIATMVILFVALNVVDNIYEMFAGEVLLSLKVKVEMINAFLIGGSPLVIKRVYEFFGVDEDEQED